MRNRRNGTSFVEISAAIMLLGVLASIVMQCAAWTQSERSEMDRREIALFEAANAMERLVSQDWETLAPQGSTEMPLSADAKNMLPGGRLTAEIRVTRDDSTSKRIMVEVNWLNRAGEPESPARLATWVSRNDARGSKLGTRE